MANAKKQINSLLSFLFSYIDNFDVDEDVSL